MADVADMALNARRRLALNREKRERHGLSLIALPRGSHRSLRGRCGKR